MKIFYFGFLFVFILDFSVEAEKLYKYKDEKDNWFFSDSAPQNSNEYDISVEQVKVEGLPQKVFISLVPVRYGSMESYLFVRNDLYAPVEIELKMTGGKNVDSVPDLPGRFVIKGFGNHNVVRIFPIKRGSISYRISSNVVMGDPSAEHNSKHHYWLPFDMRKKFLVSQGFHGISTHNESDSEYAVDIAMSVGTSIHASRSGVVVDVARDFFIGGKVKKYLERANFVMILHDDGTIATYAHLDLESVIVRPGERVREGKMIARSGNTGFSGGPHLHFVIQKNVGMELVSVPFKFVGNGGKGIVPRRGMRLGFKSDKRYLKELNELERIWSERKKVK